MDNQRPPTTTISTIAIHAANKSTIVVAFLRSIGYATLRIDEMRPRMLQLGNTVQETADLLAIHEDLIARLKSKEDQVHELLARADHLVTEQNEPDVHVYEAMAESLAMAWKELNQQLLMRGFLLTETLRFHNLAKRHEEISLQSRQLLKQVENRQFGDPSKLQQQLRSVLDDLTETTLKAVGSACDVISQIRALGAMADNLERSQETVDACLAIEKTMLSLTTEYDFLEESWKTNRPKLTAEADRSNVLYGQIQDIEQWLRTAKEAFERGDDINPLLQQAHSQRSILDDIMQASSKEHYAPELNGRIAQLQNDIENFIRLLEVRRKELRDVSAFIISATSIIHQLTSMEKDMRNANAAMAGELAPLARQKAQAVIEEGRRLVHVDNKVPQLIFEIEEKLRQIEMLARERTDFAKEQFRKDLERFESWLLNVAEKFILSKNRMGTNLSEASEFCSLHKDFITEVINKDVDFNSLLNRSHEASETERKKLNDLASRYEYLKQLLEGRAQLGSAFYQVHKFARELEASFESLDALLCSNRNFSSEKLATQMSEVFRMIQETLSQERHQGEKFIEAANSVATSDKNLIVNEACDSVRRLLTEHDRRFVNITESWKTWQQNRVQQQNIIRVVEEIQMWQEETLEKIRILDDRFSRPVMIHEREELKRKMDEVIRSIPIQREKILKAESVIKTSENEEAIEKFKMVKHKLDEIDEKLTKLRQKIETVVEELTVRESREVIRAPTIVASLKDAQIVEGNRFEFAAKVEAEPAPKIQWFKDGIDIRDNIDYRTSFVNGVASLTIEETFVEDTATYTLRAQNPVGTAETSAKLIVNSRSEMSSQIEDQAKPRFIRQLRNITVNESEDAFLDCVVVGNPEPKVVWYKEEETIKESDRVALRFAGDHCSLTIRNTMPSDSGMYTAKATNSAGEGTNFCRLTVHGKPHIPPPTPPKPVLMQTPSFAPSLENQILLEGQRAMFQVRVAGEPSPKVYWTYNEEPIRSTNEVKILEEANGWHRLVIEKVLPEHSGMYTVVAENEAGEARSGASLLVHTQVLPAVQREYVTETSTMNDGFWSDTALLSSPTPPPVPKHRYRVETADFTESQFSTTATAPEFIRPFQNEYTANELEKFKMECLLVGNPRPKVSWYFNDRLINTNSNFCQFSNIGDSYSVILEPAKLENAGYYKMVAENIRGKTESLTVLHVRPASLQRYTPQKPLTKQHVQVTEEFGEYEYEEQIPSYSEMKKVRSAYEEERRSAQKHSTRLPTPPPAKKQQLVTTHEREEKVLEAYDMEQNLKSSGRPPHFTQTLVSSVATCGDSTTFEGVVTGSPTPEVNWTKDGVELSRTSDPELSFSNIGGRVSLTIRSTRLDHEGKYMCTAKNEYGVATSSAQLVVRPKTVAPDFIRRLISEEIVEGERLQWTVQVTGDPAPKVIWLRDGQEIPNCEEVQLVEEGNGVHSMVITKVELADCGQFTCLAENSAGEARSTADLVVRKRGAEPGHYFHVTKVTQEKQVKGEDFKQTVNQSFSIENPHAASAS